MRPFLFSAFMLFSFHFVGAQVGIGTATPAATLDVTALNPTGTTTGVDGIIIPRVTRERAQSMTGTPTSTMIYVSEVVTGTAAGTTVNVTSVGFYFFNGAAWERLGTGTSNGWTTIGNTGIVDGVNYLGTAALTNVDVAFRRNNLAAGKIGATSTSFGLGALTSGASTNSSAFGNNALAANSTGAANVAIGTSALATNTTSSNNTAVGFSSLNANTAAGNSALGYRALGSNSSGANNTAVGFDAGFALSSGSNNIMIGANTVAPSATGSDQLNIGNTIYGSIGATKNIGINQTTPQGALDIVSSNNGILIPRLALLVGANSSSPVTTIADSEVIYNTASVGAGINAVTPGFYYWNTATARWIRFNTGAATGWLTTGNAGLTAGTNFIGTTDAVDVSFRRNNTASGFIGANNTAFGVGTLASNSGTNNTAFGTNALAANNTPADNTAIGYNALATNTFNAGGGNQNTAVGSGALATLNGGIGNTAVGYNALNASATLSQFNTAVGAGAMSGTNNAASQDNVAVGYNSLRQPGTITRTVAIGSNALVNAANSSTRNTAIGAFAGSATTTGTDNIFIGNSAGSAEAGASNNKLYIENTNANASNALIYGEFDTNILRVNGTLQVNNPAGVTGYALPNVRGNANEILRTDGAGGTSWVAASTIETDPQVSSTTTNAIPRWNGTTLVDGVIVDNATNVGVGMTPVAGNRLDVSGKTRTTSLETANFQMTTGATANYVLTSDATGNGTWVNPTVKPYTTTGTLTGIYNVSLAEYTVRVFNDVSEVRLPAAAANIGKVYIIIGSNLITAKILSTAGGVIYDDVTNATITTINPNERYMVQSDGNLNWIVIGR
ncbi:beta strand repeat-containing protein [Flavobacterium sp. 25HG05S-40]|uniref:beta strand repeat-containing protein n=1 Tax=Flavobacterium sp. 25HG05S-40 TaxID=3458682 RepID=UPI0040439F6F